MTRLLLALGLGSVTSYFVEAVTHDLLLTAFVGGTVTVLVWIGAVLTDYIQRQYEDLAQRPDRPSTTRSL